MSLLHELERKWRRWADAESGVDQSRASAYTICADELAAALAAGDRAVAWRHTLHMELDQSTVRVTEDDENPWGVAGDDYSLEYVVTSEPLLTHPAAVDEGARTVRLDLSVFDQPGDPRSNLIARGWTPPEATTAQAGAELPERARNEAFNLADTVIEHMQCGREQEARAAIMEAFRNVD